jgi:hypothetical protein
MDETRFKSLIRDAIGDEAMHPRLVSSVRTRLAERPGTATGTRLPLLIAAAVLVAVAAAAWLVAPFLTSRSTQIAVPAASPSAAAAVDPLNCRLPVLGQDGNYGFVDTRTGQFTVGVSPLPMTPQAYSTSLHRWLPVPPAQVEPDGTRYVWLNGRELHRFDIGWNRDVVLATFGFDVYIWRWELDGIRVSDQPFEPMRPGGVTTWLVDPATGAAAQQVTPIKNFPFTFLPGDPQGTGGAGGGSLHPLGTDSQGHVIWWFFNLDYPGAVDWVFYETAPGERTYIFRGGQDDSTGFDPDNAFGDGTGVWFTDHLHGAIWYWQPGIELHKVALTGLPARTSLAVAGPCF